MKKHLFTAVLAIVAVSGAYALNAKKLVLPAEYGTPGITTCQVGTVQDNCNAADGTRCQVIETGQNAFQSGSNCLIPLFRN